MPVLYSQSRGEGSPVIALHGMFGMGDNLGSLARALSDQFTVWSLDLRNHGRSPWYDSMSLDEMAADVIEFLDSKAIASADVVGHSLGGKVGMQVALNYPERVRRLVVADIAPVEYAGNHDEVFNALRAVAAQGVTSRGDAAQLLSAHITEQGVSQFLLKSLYRNEQGCYDWRMNVDALQQCYDQLRAGNSETGVFKGPTLIIKGENSAYIQSKHQPLITQRFPSYEFKIIQGAGHWLHAEKPELFNGLVKRFLVAA